MLQQAGAGIEDYTQIKSHVPENVLCRRSPRTAADAPVGSGLGGLEEPDQGSGGARAPAPQPAKSG